MNLEPRPKRAVVAVIYSDEKFLAIKRSNFVRAPGKICFPGGGIENGESETDALVREIREELGVAIAPIQRIWESETPWGVHVCWYTAKLLQNNFDICQNEVEWVRWIERSELSNSSDLLVSNAQFFAALDNGEIDLG